MKYKEKDTQVALQQIIDSLSEAESSLLKALREAGYQLDKHFDYEVAMQRTRKWTQRIKEEHPYWIWQVRFWSSDKLCKYVLSWYSKQYKDYRLEHTVIGTVSGGQVNEVQRHAGQAPEYLRHIREASWGKV